MGLLMLKLPMLYIHLSDEHAQESPRVFLGSVSPILKIRVGCTYLHALKLHLNLKAIF